MVFAEACRDNTTRTTLEKMKEKGVTNDELVLPDQVPSTTKKTRQISIATTTKTATTSS
jgi:hypothetical protein